MKWIEVRVKDWPGGDTTQDYAVNNSGDGLFVRLTDGTWQQTVGTSDVHVDTPEELMDGLALGLDYKLELVRCSANWED